METEAEALGQPWSFSDGSGGPVVGCPLWWDGLGAGVLQFTTAASVSSLDSRPLALRRLISGCSTGPSALLHAPLLTSSVVGAPSCWGCGSLSPRPRDQHFLEYSFPGRNHPVDFSQLLSLNTCKADGNASAGCGFLASTERMAGMWQWREDFKAQLKLSRQFYLIESRQVWEVDLPREVQA